MLKAGVLGAGHLGKIHLKLLKQSTKFELVGFYDADKTASALTSEEFGYTSFPSMEKLIEASDMVVVVTPTSTHFECAQKVIQAGKHVFIEKPITETVTEAAHIDRKSTRLNSSHVRISYAVFCLKKK